MESQEDNKLAATISVILNTFFLVVTVAGNLLALLVLGQAGQLRAPVRLLMANLAVPDLALGGIVLPYVVHAALNTGPTTPDHDSNSDIVCQAVGFLRVLSLSGSSFTLLALSYERYVAIAYPLKHTHMITVGTVVKYAVVVWICAIIVAVLPFWGLGQYRYSPNQFTCWPEEHNYTLVFVFFVFCLTFLTMASMYLCIFRAVKKHRSIIHALVLRLAQGFTGQKVEKFRATTTITLVLGVYGLTWAPFCGAHALPILFSGLQVTSASKTIATCLLYANPACNPWIYCGLNAKFRDTFKKTARSFWKWLRAVFSAPAFFDTGRNIGGNPPQNIRVVVIRPTNTSQLHTDVRGYNHTRAI